jgi:hypothetical protein
MANDVNPFSGITALHDNLEVVNHVFYGKSPRHHNNTGHLHTVCHVGGRVIRHRPSVVRQDEPVLT